MGCNSWLCCFLRADFVASVTFTSSSSHFRQSLRFALQPTTF